MGLGVPRDRILNAVNPVTQVRTLIRPSPANYMARNAKIAPFCVNVFEKLLEGVVGGRKPSTKGRRIYVARLDAALRKLVNEAEQIQKLLPLGFEIITPSSLNLIEQIVAFSDAELVFGTHGAGLTNIAFAPRASKLLEIFPGHYMDGSYFSLKQLIGQEYRSWTSKNPLGKEAQGTHQPWSLAIDTVIEWLNSQLR
jgi:capsular polysaccharide biosynthesis protein